MIASNFLEKYRRALAPVFKAGILCGLLLSMNMTEAATIGRPPTQNYTGLVGYWTFDGPDMVGGTVMDRSGQGNHGDMENMATSSAYVKGKIGQALNFDGVNDEIRVAENNALDMTSNFTIALWVKPTHVDLLDNIYIKDGSGGIQFGLGGFSNNIGYFICAAGVNCAFDSKGSYNLGVWNNVAVTRNGNEWTLYNDGVAVYTVTDATAISDTSGQLFIGSQAGAMRFFNGALDEVRVYNRALSADEIKRLYGAGASKFSSASNRPSLSNADPGPVSWWTFDGPDMVGGTVMDRSGRGNHGDMENTSTSTVYTKGKIGQALNLDGVNDFISVQNGIYTPSTPGYSISMWVKGPHIPTQNELYTEINTSQSCNICIDNSDSLNRVRIFITGTVTLNQTSTAVVFDNTWHHIVWTDNAGAGKLYVDGVQDSSDFSYTPSASVALLRARIGSINQFGADTSFLKGSIDDVRTYNRVLSPTEIKKLYNVGAVEMNTSSVNPALSGAESGLIGWWTFDGPDMAGGAVRDRSNSNHHGTMQNMATATAYVKGKIGQALSFDGVNDYVTMGNPNSSRVTGGWTVSTWVKFPTFPVTSYNTFVTKTGTSNATNYGLGYDNNTLTSGSGWIAWVDGAGFFRLKDSTSAVSANTWYHVTGVFDPTLGIARMYVNGVQTATTTVPGVADSGADGNLNIGRDSCCGGDGYAKAVLDEVRVYSRPLSPDEVRNLYNRAK